MTAWIRLRSLGVAVPIALVTFWTVAAWHSETFGVWHEEIANFPSAPYSILADIRVSRTLTPQLEASCATRASGSTHFSAERPNWVLCLNGRSYPVMVTVYSAGYLYWPTALARGLHQDDAFRLRKLSLLLGTLSLVLTWLLVARLADRRRADAAVLLTAASPPFAFLHGLLVLYELLPWTLTLLALCALVRCDALARGSPAGARVSTKSLAVAALALGLAVAANLKAVLLLGPLLLVSLLAGVRWRRVRLWQWATAAGIAAGPLVPVVIFAATDPLRRFSSQVVGRLGIASGTPLLKLLGEPLNLAIFWTDVGAYFDAVAGLPASRNWPLIAVAWAALGYLLFAVARWRRTRDGAAAASAALIVTFVLVSTFLYNQYPPGNYSPLHSVFGVATAIAVVAAGTALEARLRVRWVTALLVGIVAAGLVYNSVRRGDASTHLPLPVNATAQRAAVSYLLAQPRPGPTLLTATYNLAGVPESLGHGALRPVQVHRYVLGCEERDQDALRRCTVDRWRRLLASPEWQPPLLVLGPATIVLIDEPAVRHLWPALEEAARATGAVVRRERGFGTGAAGEQLVLYRVERP